jgi:hypothetical protein
VGVGANVYFSYKSTAVNDTPGVSAALISDATTLPATTSWPKSSGGKICVDLVYDGFRIFAPGQDLTNPETNASMVRVWEVNGTQVCSFYGPDPLLSESQEPSGILYMVYDGVNAWFNITEYHSAGQMYQYMQRTDMIDLVPYPASGIIRNWYQMNTKLFSTGFAELDINTPGPMVFDGRDIWLIPKIRGDRLQRVEHSMIR